MAGLGGKNWSFQEEVTSSDVNGFLADQVVMRFGGTAARDAGFGGSGEPTLAEGMVSYLDDANRLDVYTGAAWSPVSKVLQVVSTTKTDTFSTTSGSFVDVTGLTASITPSSTSNKILVTVSITGGNDSGTVVFYRLRRDSTDIDIGDASSSRVRSSGGTWTSNSGTPTSITMTHLDSPATTSAITYGVQIASQTGTQNVYLNRTHTDTNSASFARTASSITVMEISA